MNKQVIGVVDYEAGNLRTIETVLEHLGASYITSKDPKVLIKSDKILFPGVGDAGFSMKVLCTYGLNNFLIDWANSGKLLFGICVGCQLLFNSSEERDTKCLGILPGKVKRFPSGIKDNNGSRFKVPHMGWNQVNIEKNDHPLFRDINNLNSFYFVHSFYPVPSDKSDVLATTDYIDDFACAVARDNVLATQFHPEKSGEIGLKLMQNFLKL